MADAADPKRYKTETFNLPGAPGGDVRFDMRRPVGSQGERHSEDNSERNGDEGTDSERLPVLIILAGIKTGHQTLDRLPAPGNNAIIAYAYPYDRERWKGQSTAQRALVAYHMSRDVRGQIDTLIRWVKQQPWADPERVNIAGGSLGAIVLPMILRHVQAAGENVRTATFAYGGAGRLTLGYLSLRHRSRLLGAACGGLAWLLLRHMEPAQHLPHLFGEFLAISSPQDELVPARCSNLFEALLPEPKTIVHLEGDHVDATNPELLFEVVSVAREWMHARGALNE